MIEIELLSNFLQSTALTNLLILLIILEMFELKFNVKQLFQKHEEREYKEVMPITATRLIEDKSDGVKS